MALSCPSSIRFKSHDLKYILKQILSKHLPKEFIYRKKQGFSMPVNKWFRGDWKDALQDMCESMKKDPHINNQYISDMVNMHQKGGRNFGNLLYSLLFYKYWLNAE
jgi:asparagine synthase (glutamine-hydrolysing)